MANIKFVLCRLRIVDSASKEYFHKSSILS